MKIALELQPCLKKRSGIGVYTYELARCLQGYKDIELFGNIFNFMGRNNIEDDIRGLEFKKNYCWLMPYGVYRRVWHHIPVGYNDFFKEQVDISHFFNFIVPPRVKGKIVNTIHDLTFELYPETMDQANLKRIKDDIAYSIERSDKLIAVSEATKMDMIKYLKLDPAQIEVVYNGVHYELFNEPITEEKREAVRKKYRLPEHYILYMGTLEPRKNIELLIEAFKVLKKEGESIVQNVKLVLAGKKGWFFEEIFKKIEVLGLTEEVIDLGYIYEEDKVALYQMAKCFTFPSLFEGFGIPVIEAMAAGVPVITSNVSSLPEVAGDAAILINPKDVIALAEGMYRLLVDETYREILIQKGYNNAQCYSWESAAAKLHQIYQNLMQ